MRRPHPRFDEARNAWVTRAGGKLKILASGSKNKDTEVADWDAFYAHMAKLGNPVEGSSLPGITLDQLADKYGDGMKRKVEAGRMKPRTLDYYAKKRRKDRMTAVRRILLDDTMVKLLEELAAKGASKNNFG